MTNRLMTLLFALIVLCAASDQVHAQSKARGMGISMPLVGRLIGGGNTLFTTAIDVSNNSASSTQVDFLLDGEDLTTRAPITLDGSISAAGQLLPQGTGGAMRAQSNAHFDDFIDA